MQLFFFFSLRHDIFSKINQPSAFENTTVGAKPLVVGGGYHADTVQFEWRPRLRLRLKFSSTGWALRGRRSYVRNKLALPAIPHMVEDKSEMDPYCSLRMSCWRVQADVGRVFDVRWESAADLFGNIGEASGPEPPHTKKKVQGGRENT